MEINPKKLSIIGGLSIVFAVVATAVISTVLYQHTVDLLTQNLRERLQAIVLTASVEFEASDLEQLRVEDDWKKPAWGRVVNKLRRIREANKDILFAYIIRKAPTDSSAIEFVADSHSINPYAKIDLNGDGAIDDADLLQWPGQPYEEPPTEIFYAYEKATTSSELIHDQWGVEIVGYAPIKDLQGNTSAVVAVDMKADDFTRITQQTFYPFMLFILVLVLVILILSYVIIFVWNRRINLVTELDRQKDELLGIVSHQLAAPITAIKWYLELLLDGDIGSLNKDQRSQLETMKGVSGNLSDLVSMILDVSRIQLGRMRVERQEFNLQDFLDEIFDVVALKAKEKKQHFSRTLDPSVTKVSLDKRLTRMVVENLLTNAIKYTPEGGSVSFEAYCRGDKLIMLVKDTGFGIPKEEQKRVFEKLFRASNTRDKIEGNGFGLYVVKGAVDSQGGHISFVSNVGEGTEFRIELPMSKVR